MDIAIMGYGTVGSGTVNVLNRNRELIASDGGEVIRVKSILDLREFPGDPYEDRIVHDFESILNDPTIQVVAETMGGIHPAFEYISQLLAAGKSVVTSNKDLVAAHGEELVEIAAENGVDFYYEASVGGGIPVIRMINECMIQEKITEITAILNGTTNYILTEMEDEGASFEETLEDAQELGYAERNPESDVEAMDPARKLAILSTHAYCLYVDWEKVERRGITNITKEDIEIAKAMDYHIKLIARSRMIGPRLFAGVEPIMLHEDHPLARVEGVYNGITVKGNMLDDITIYGKGAGAYPTGSAVAADIICAALNKAQGISKTTSHHYHEVKPESYSSLGQEYMIRTNKEVSLPMEDIISGMVLEGPIYAYFTKQLKTQELRDLFRRLERRGVQVLNYFVVEAEDPVD
ncbi:MAG: homoserine dehydrogenase [Firmicutes bacterium]|nr:homoserine dehydrogenase [Bacillota bacterium]